MILASITIVGKHPREFGFRLGITFRVNADGSIEEITRERAIRSEKPVIYVALRRGDGCALKIGVSAGLLWRRWNGTLRVIGAPPDVKLRPNEREDQRRWRECAKGETVEVWSKAAITTRLPYQELNEPELSLRHVEETYFDWYYAPLLGKSLDLRMSQTC